MKIYEQYYNSSRKYVWLMRMWQYWRRNELFFTLLLFFSSNKTISIIQTDPQEDTGMELVSGVNVDFEEVAN